MRGIYLDPEGDYWPIEKKNYEVDELMYYASTILWCYDEDSLQSYPLGSEELFTTFDFKYVMPLELMKGM